MQLLGNFSPSAYSWRWWRSLAAKFPAMRSSKTSPAFLALAVENHLQPVPWVTPRYLPSPACVSCCSGSHPAPRWAHRAGEGSEEPWAVLIRVTWRFMVLPAPSVRRSWCSHAWLQLGLGRRWVVGGGGGVWSGERGGGRGQVFWAKRGERGAEFWALRL